MAKKIRTRQDADPATIMDIMDHAAEGVGFLFEQHDATTATASDGGKKVSGNATATRARSASPSNPAA